MRLVAWNIRAGGGRRVEAIAQALKTWAPDIAVLSEFRGTPPSRVLASRLLDLGLNYQRTTEDPSYPPRNALLVASRYPLRLLRAPPVVDSTRIIHVRVTLPRGLNLRLLGIHVPNRETGRKYPFLNAVRHWAESLEPKHLGVIVGDTNSGISGLDEQTAAFNTVEGSWFKQLARAGWLDLYRYLHGRRRAYTWYSPNGDNGFRLDQLFMSQAPAERSLAMRYRWAGGDRRSGISDHAAIVCELR